MAPIKGSKVLVTGSNRGLGRALVQAFLGGVAATVYAAVRDARKAVFEHPRVQTVELDVTNDTSVAEAVARCGDVDYVVNNAATLFNTPLIGVPDLEGARNEMETNYWGVLRMCRAFAPPLSSPRNGAIVNILSIGSLTSVPFCGSYCASKAAAWSLTQAVRAELAPQGVSVVAAFPGPIATEMARPEDKGARCPPDVMAKTIVEALGAGETMIFPDVVSQAFAAHYAASPLSMAVRVPATAE